LPLFEREGILKKLLTGFFLVAMAFLLSFGPQSCQTTAQNSQAIAIIEELSEKSTTNPSFSLSIIPGRVGFGMETPAGSGPDRVGGAVLRVTTLAEDGPGSFSEALLAKGPRTVVFDVSGYITLTDNIEIIEPYLTIAGQTAPSPGITLKGAGLVIATHDVLVQHIRIRVGDAIEGPPFLDRREIIIANLSGEENGVHNVVVDHVSGSWAIDENFATWFKGVQDITVINCIISEGLWHSLSPDGPHSTGFLVGDGTHRLSVIGNLFAHNDQRNMYVHGDTSTLFVNNLIYNWHGSSPQGGASVYGSDEGPLFASIVGNAYIRGKTTRPGDKSIPVSIWNEVAKGSKVYLSDNKDFLSPGDPYSVSLIEPNFNVLTKVPPVWIPSLVIKNVEDVKSEVLNNAGARPRDRDKVDLRIVNDVKTGTGRIIDSQKEVGGWPPLAKNVRGTGGVPVLSTPSNAIQSSGYTELEEWLHRLARQLEYPG
jgi:hypothetical protein